MKYYKQYKSQISKLAIIKLNTFSNNISAAQKFLPSGNFFVEIEITTPYYCDETAL